MDSLANRYAAALISIAEEENNIVEYQSACKLIRSAIKENPDLMRILLSSFVDYEDKVKTLRRILNPFGLPNFTNFFLVILDNKRMHEIDSILKEFNSLCNEKQGIEEGKVYSVTKLADAKVNEIEEAISKKLGRKVELTNEIDERLIGGVKVVINDHIFDGSVASKVDSLKNSLLKGGN